MSRFVLLPIAALFAASCAGRVAPATHSLSPGLQLDLFDIRRVWVAGFVAHAHDDIDLSSETVRLLRQDLREWSRAQVVDAEPLMLDTQEQLHDSSYWRRLGEEYDAPLIVTGSLKLILAPPAIVERGRRTFYYARAGRVFEATAVLIDGSSGRILAERPLPSRMRYGSGNLASGLALYYEMMDQAMPDWLAAIGHASALR